MTKCTRWQTHIERRQRPRRTSTRSIHNSRHRFSPVRLLLPHPTMLKQPCSRLPGTNSLAQEEGIRSYHMTGMLCGSAAETGAMRPWSVAKDPVAVYLVLVRGSIILHLPP